MLTYTEIGGFCSTKTNRKWPDRSGRRGGRKKNRNIELGFNPTLIHSMFTICVQNDSAKAADFEAQQQTGTQR